MPMPFHLNHSRVCAESRCLILILWSFPQRVRNFAQTQYQVGTAISNPSATFFARCSVPALPFRWPAPVPLFALRRRQPGRRSENVSHRFQRRIKRRIRIMRGRCEGAQYLSSSDEHCIRDPARARSDHAQAHTGKDKRVVALSDVNQTAIGHDGRERTAGGDQCSSIRPSEEIGRSRLALRGWIRERKNYRAIDVTGHLTHDLFSESAGLRGSSDQNCRLHIAHHVRKSNP